MQDPGVSWGFLLQETRNFAALAHHSWKLIPLLFIIVTVLMFNFLGDGLRDAAIPTRSNATVVHLVVTEEVCVLRHLACAVTELPQIGRCARLAAQLPGRGLPDGLLDDANARTVGDGVELADAVSGRTLGLRRVVPRFHTLLNRKLHLPETGADRER